MSNISADLIWALNRSHNSFLVKRKEAGGVQFSRDPLNLTNKHSRKQAGFANEKAVGVQDSGNGGIVLVTKKTKTGLNKPASNTNTVTFGKNTPTRKIYKGVATHVGKNGYRSDLLSDAVQRTSAIRWSQKEKKEKAASKPRGAKAQKIEA
ncbi:putative 60s ribosomal protein l28 [Phaeomoniella chlamydospora]|uniref:Putative 60s ribosomal protein l28 n=1 Tax=Phaeomoniella chlamydospora TaxID=158046 RepID=A0A0G2GWM0_PHACM|nr:putative 60s ribosomal protein l28 [Phaeomoniella chlamydospora]